MSAPQADAQAGSVPDAPLDTEVLLNDAHNVLLRIGIDNSRSAEMDLSCNICGGHSHFENPARVVITHKPTCILERLNKRKFEARRMSGSG